jgi:hypothetical protein
VSTPPPSPPDPGGTRSLPDDYLSADDLRNLDIDPALVPIVCPGATELTGHGGVRCWAVADLAPLLGRRVP